MIQIKGTRIIETLSPFFDGSCGSVHVRCLKWCRSSHNVIETCGISAGELADARVTNKRHVSGTGAGIQGDLVFVVFNAMLWERNGRLPECNKGQLEWITSGDSQRAFPSTLHLP